MSKIMYHKNCFRHDEVRKAKRMLNKIDKQFGGVNGIFFCSIDLTGVNKIDRKEVKFYVEKHLKNLKGKIEKELLKNQPIVEGGVNDNYEEGFYMPTLLNVVNLVELLNDVYLFIRDHYPELQVKKTDDYILKSETGKEKHEELKRYYELNPVVGFCQEWFVVNANGESKKLYSYTFSYHDLEKAKSVYVQYV